MIKKIFGAMLLTNLAFPVNHAQAGDLNIYTCNGNQTITGQGMETGPMNIQVCAESKSQAEAEATNFFVYVSDQYWQGSVMCFKVGRAPIYICSAPRVLI